MVNTTTSKAKDFMKLLFNDYKNHYLEIRTLSKKNNSTVNREFIKLEDIETYSPDLENNVYVGIRPRINKGNGKSYNTAPTKLLWADYDNIEIESPTERYKALREQLKALGVPQPNIVVNSGKGLHTYWIMDKDIEDPTPILRHLSEKTGADIKATDKARILRLPSTFNHKYGVAIKVDILRYNKSDIYPLEYFIKSIGMNTKGDSLKALQSDYRDSLKANKIYNLPKEINRYPDIKNMLINGVEKGERNFALGRITKALQQAGKTQKQALAIVIEWNNKNKPQEDIRKLKNDFIAYWNNDYKLLGNQLNDSDKQNIIQKYLGDTENNKLYLKGIEKDLIIDNRIFNNYQKFTGTDIAIYLMLRRHSKGLDINQLQLKLTSRATNKAIATIKTLRDSLKRLQKSGYVITMKGNRKAGKPDIYKYKRQGNFGMGYTPISNGAVNGFIDGRATKTEFKLYVLLLTYSYGETIVYPSIAEISRYMGTTTSSVSELLKNLERNDYIKIKKTVKNGIEYNRYKLIL